MAEITLKDYQKKLDRLLRDEAYDEVIHHCQHILKHYPRNVATYRLLGRGLVGASQWNVAIEIFRRVLSAHPTDYLAHRGLGQAYQANDQLEDAIWHYERALEQDPNNEKLIESLRQLYAHARGIENARVPLTAGAVARQHMRGGLYDQAVDVLRDALQQSPDRVDLLLLLAHTLWHAGLRVDAAETALDVLNIAPNCVEANRILTELWLAEERPFDAQRYLANIENTDPYLALELATGQQVPKDALTLEELDYQAVAQRELVTSSPDWLDTIDGLKDGAEPEAETTDELLSDEGGSALDWLEETPELDESVAEELADLPVDDLNDDWLADIDEMKGIGEDPMLNVRRDHLPENLLEPDEDEESVPEDEAPLLSDDWFSDFAESEDSETTDAVLDDLKADEPVEEAPSVPYKKSGRTGFTGLLSLLGENEADEAADSGEDEEEPDFIGESIEESFEDELFAEDAEDLPGIDEAAQEIAAEDLGLDWLNEDAAESDEEGLPDFETPIEANDPMAWMYNSGIELEADEEPAPALDFGQEDAKKAQLPDSENDPMAWLQDYGDDIIADDAQPDSFASVDKPVASSGETDPLAWLQDSGVELFDDDDQLEEASPAEAASLETVEEADLQDWLADESVLDELLDMEALSSSDFEINDELSWEDMADENLEASLPGEEDAFFLEAEPSDEAELDEVAEELDWPENMSDTNPDQQPEWPDSGSSEFDDDIAFDSLEWLNEAESEQEAAAPIPEDTTAETSDDDADDSGLEWPSAGETDGALVSQPESSAGMDDADETFDDDTFDWGADEDEAEESAELAMGTDQPDWLSEVGQQVEWDAEEDEAEESAELAMGANQPDWLSEVGQQVEWDAEEDEAATPESAMDTDQPDWLSEVGQQVEWDAEEDEAATPEPAMDADQPDWLSEVGQQVEWDAEEDEEATPEPAMDADQPDWLSELGGQVEWDAEEDEAATPEPAMGADQPDWLSELGGQAEWDAEEDEAEESAELAMDADQPDWLSAVGAVADAEESLDEESEWDADEEAAFEAATESDEEDWLSGVGMSDEDDQEESAGQAFAASFSWRDDSADAETEAPEEADWLSEIAPLEEVEDEEYESESLAWDAGETAAPGEMEASEEPDWLSEIGPMTKAEGETPEEELAWDAAEESLPDAEPAAEAPDWLSAISSVDSDAVEINEADFESVVPGAADWLSEIGPEAESEDVEALIDMADESALDWMAEDTGSPIDEIDWLSEIGSLGEEEASYVDEVDLLNEVDTEAIDWGNEDVEAPVSQTAADWLADMADESADDLEPEAYAEEDELWGVDALEQPLDDEALEVEEPDWLSQIKPQELEDEAGLKAPVVESAWSDMAEPDEAMMESDDVGMFEVMADEELEPAPAENAPDWLNAMVPGLDVDYDAPEDEPIEQDFAAATATHRMRAVDVETAETTSADEFGWVADIVDEESQPLERTPESTERRRFVFSRPPIWLRQERAPTDSRSELSAASDSAPVSTAVSANDDLPSWLMDDADDFLGDENDESDDDFDLPDDWLR